MACFIVPLSIGFILSIIRKIFSKASENLKLDILTAMMFGGALVLAVEHMWHGELVPWPPFLTAMKNPEDWAVAVSEMMHAGTLMTIAVTGAWGSILLFDKFRATKLAEVKPVKQIMGSVK